MRASAVGRSLLVAVVALGAMRAAATPVSIFDLPVTLADESGAPVRFDQWRGRRLAVAMGYTKCQRVCPVFTLNIMRELEARARDASPPLELVMVTLDPKTDTPAVLAAYKDRHGLVSPHWHFLTGAMSDIERVAHALDAPFLAVDDHIRHRLTVVVFAPTGEVDRVYDWDHRDVDPAPPH